MPLIEFLQAPPPRLDHAIAGPRRNGANAERRRYFGLSAFGRRVARAEAERRGRAFLARQRVIGILEVRKALQERLRNPVS